MILNEEIYGNIATVYHRSKTNSRDFKRIFEKRQWKSGSGAGNLYGFGLYTVFTLSDNSKSYGNYLYKLHVKGIKNFYIFLPDIYNKVWGTNKTYEEIIEEQNKRFDINVKKYTDFIHDGLKLHSKVAGIVFRGSHDGDVCLIFEPHNVIPIKYSSNNGKTWKNISISNKYKSEAFNKAGDIVNYLNMHKDTLRKIEDGNFIKAYLSDYTGSMYPDDDDIFYFKKFKKLTSLADIKTIIGTNDIIYTNKNFFDSKSFGVFDKNRNLVNIIFYDGRTFKESDKYSNYSGHIKEFVNTVFGDKTFEKTTEKAINRSDLAYQKMKLRNSEKSGEVHFKLDAGRETTEKANKLIPDSIKNFIEIKNSDIYKNVYDLSSKLKGDITFKIKENNFLEKNYPEDYKEKILYYNIENDNFFHISKGKLSDYLKIELDKSKFFAKLNTLLTKEGLKRIKANKNGWGIDFPDSAKKDKNVETNLRSRREKEKRELEGKYIGKHQYNNLNSVKTYFNY